MNRTNLLAFMVWAIDRDLLGIPVTRAWKLFQKDAKGCKAIYLDPNNPLLYCPEVAKMGDIEFFTDYVLTYAQSRVMSGINGYGKYNKPIINYTK